MKQEIQEYKNQILAVLEEYPIRDIQKGTIGDILERLFWFGYNIGQKDEDIDDCMYMTGEF